MADPLSQPQSTRSSAFSGNNNNNNDQQKQASVTTTDDIRCSLEGFTAPRPPRRSESTEDTAQMDTNGYHHHNNGDEDLERPLRASHRSSTRASSPSRVSGYDPNEEGAEPETPKEPHEKLGVWGVAAFVFVSTAAGPFGVEGTVSSAGPLPTLLFTFLCPLLIIVPICLMMEELGSWMPTNHGSIRWVTRGLGPTAGFFNAFYQLMMNTVDLAVYPALASDYLFQQFAKGTKVEDNFAAKYFTRLAVILVFGIPSYLPMKDVGILSAVITILIMAPFVVGFFAGVKNINASSWHEVNEGSDFDISTLLAVGLWMYTGFLANSNITGECKPRALLKGQLIALVFDVLFYFAPLAVVLQIDTDWNNWTDGYLVDLFNKVLPGLGYAVAVAGACSGIGLYASSLATYCRTMWGIADLGWLPQLLRRTNRYDAPHINVTILLFTTAILNLLDFDFLVKLEFVFASFTYIFFVLSFLLLRYREPFNTRPEWAWQVPGGTIFGIILPMPLVFLVSSVVGSDFTDMRLLGSWAGMTVFAFGLHYYLGKNRTAHQIQALKRLIGGEDLENLEEIDLRATEICPFPGQRYE